MPPIGVDRADPGPALDVSVLGLVVSFDKVEGGAPTQVSATARIGAIRAGYETPGARMGRELSPGLRAIIGASSGTPSDPPRPVDSWDAVEAAAGTSVLLEGASPCALIDGIAAGKQLDVHGLEVGTEIVKELRRFGLSEGLEVVLAVPSDMAFGFSIGLTEAFEASGLGSLVNAGAAGESGKDKGGSTKGQDDDAVACPDAVRDAAGLQRVVEAQRAAADGIAASVKLGMHPGE